MKILHCCLSAFYIDNFSYQENILPRFHKALGYDVQIVASTETYLGDLKKGFAPAGSYTNEDGILVTRLAYVRWLPLRIAEKLRLYRGLINCLEEFKPDIIFLHDCQFLSITDIINFVKQKNVTIYADCHTDFVNSGRSWFSRNILHRIIYRHCVQSILPYTKQFYGTLPLRCDFLHNVYDVPLTHIRLLPFGADDTIFDYSKKEAIRSEIRAQYNIHPDDFVLVSGGKIDSRKNIDKLLEAFGKIKTNSSIGSCQIKLVLFGRPTSELESLINKLINQNGIIYLDWLPAKEIYKFFLSSDLAIFPGTHSVLWEEAAGIGLPLVVKRWKGIEHINLGGNCVFLEESTVEEISAVIVDLFSSRDKFTLMRIVAETKGPQVFTYSKISFDALN
jgi:1,2-diacylglycerol 3-alpha-glucosyltransferase